MKGRLAPGLLTPFCDPLCEKFKEQILLWGKDKQGTILHVVTCRTVWNANNVPYSF